VEYKEKPSMVDAGLYRARADKLPPEFLPLLFATWPGATIPGLPPEELQRNSVGASGFAALAEGYQMFRLVRGVCERYGRHTSQDAVILDYGCGWGRIIRFFLTVYDNRNVYGVDVDPDMVAYCQSLIGTGRYAPTSGRPPLDFEDGSIDVLYAYSVFSHLAPGLQDALIAEFYRIVRPGGFVFLTTRMRSFIDECVALRNLSELDAYTAALAAAFPDPEKAKRQYDAGEFLFRPYPAEIDRLGPDYGEAIVPRGYGEQHWSRHFHLLDFIDDRARLRQACFVLER
jgi:SAM-dependent methyltransferase